MYGLNRKSVVDGMNHKLVGDGLNRKSVGDGLKAHQSIAQGNALGLVRVYIRALKGHKSLDWHIMVYALLPFQGVG